MEAIFVRSAVHGIVRPCGFYLGLHEIHARLDKHLKFVYISVSLLTIFCIYCYQARLLRCLYSRCRGRASTHEN